MKLVEQGIFLLTSWNNKLSIDERKKAVSLPSKIQFVLIIFFSCQKSTDCKIQRAFHLVLLVFLEQLTKQYKNCFSHKKSSILSFSGGIERVKNLTFLLCAFCAFYILPNSIRTELRGRRPLLVDQQPASRKIKWSHKKGPPHCMSCGRKSPSRCHLHGTKNHASASIHLIYDQNK